jgi:hypothetical protein
MDVCKSLGVLTDNVRMIPITFNGCPFLQAISDVEAQKQQRPFSSQKTLVIWETRGERDMNDEQLNCLRTFKIDQVADFLKDMKAIDIISDARRVETREGEYIAAKENFNQTMKSHPLESKGVGLSYPYS